MPSDPRDYKLEISGLTPSAAGESSDKRSAARPFLGIHFACCGVYQRIYREHESAHYAGRCPRCRREVIFAVGTGGSASRIFTVS